MDSHAVRNPRTTFNSPKTPTNLLLTGSFTRNSQLTHILYVPYIINCSQKKAREKKILKSQGKYISSTVLKKKSCLNGPAQFKPVLLKGQLYTCSFSY